MRIAGVGLYWKNLINKNILNGGVLLMSVSLEEFKREYTKAVIEGYAAIFAGAGLSRAAGYANWKELLSVIARDIGLDVDKETDLVAVAQYYKNEKGDRRDGINQRIINEFTRNAQQNVNVEILTRLPIISYWTTNYDRLIEENIRANNRIADIKITQDNLATNLTNRDAIVYKIHGDALFPNETILIKDDYETFNLKRGLFTTALKGDLISKTFLFVGFSFEDPNLNSILARIKALLGENVREHYCFFKTVDSSSGDDIDYLRAKQNLIVQDLGRYGIRSLMINSYEEITGILNEVERRCYLNNIFISGSMAVECDGWNIKEAEFFSYQLSQILVASNYKITSGFGVGIGSAVINGALEEIMHSKYKHVDEYLRLRPFPQFASDESHLADIWTEYRREMLRECGVVVFMFGNKIKDNQTVMADGMMEEFLLAKERGARIIPIASTGGTTSQIFSEMISKYF